MKKLVQLFVILLLSASVNAVAQTKVKKETKKVKVKLNDKSIFNLDATWVSQNKKKVKLKQYKGKPLVMALIYASCPHVCPVTVSDITKIRNGLPKEMQGKVNFVLVTIDPKTDTPKKLKKFAKERGVPEWTFLNGGEDAVLELAMMLGVKYKKFPNGSYSHSNLISIMNKEGVVVHKQVGLNQDPTASTQVLRKLIK